jgi:hypothetical protein
MEEPNDIEDGSVLNQDRENADEQVGSHNASRDQEHPHSLDGNTDEIECDQDDKKTDDEISELSELSSEEAEDQYERPKRNKSAGHSTFTPTLTKKKQPRSKQVKNSSPFVKLERDASVFPASIRHSSYLDTELLVSNDPFSIISGC